MTEEKQANDTAEEEPDAEFCKSQCNLYREAMHEGYKDVVKTDTYATNFEIGAFLVSVLWLGVLLRYDFHNKPNLSMCITAFLFGWIVLKIQANAWARWLSLRMYYLIHDSYEKYGENWTEEGEKESKKYDQYIWIMRWTDNAASVYMAIALIVLFIKTYGIFETV